MRLTTLLAILLIASPTLLCGEETSKPTPLFDGKSLGAWESTEYGGEGEISVDNGVIVMEQGVMLTGIHYTKKDLPKTNYELTWQGKRLNGVDFFAAVTFPVGDSYASFIPGGWGGAVVGISSIDKKDASENETTKYIAFDDNKWYHFKIRVTPEKIEAWIDKKQVIDLETEGKKISTRNEVDLSQPLGFFAWECAAELKGITLKKLDN